MRKGAGRDLAWNRKAASWRSGGPAGELRQERVRAVCLHRKEAGRREVLEHVGGVRDSGSPRRHEVVGLLLELKEASPALGKTLVRDRRGPPRLARVVADHPPAGRPVVHETDRAAGPVEDSEGQVAGREIRRINLV